MNISEVKGLYRQCQSLLRRMDSANRMEELAGESAKGRFRTEYYSWQHELQEKLRELLRQNFLLLSKPQLVHLLSMCSSHRPMEPHSVLKLVSMRYEETYP